jgi:hypothetical protein
MKKIIYLSILMFSLILTSTSCSKENSLVPDVKPEQTGFTAANLVGNWNFVSLEYQGRTISGYDSEFKKTVNCATISFRDVTTTTLKIYTDCSVLLKQGETWTSEPLKYTLSKTELNWNDGTFKFTILSATATTLKLKLIAGMSSNIAKDGIYTLNKQ